MNRTFRIVRRARLSQATDRPLRGLGDAVAVVARPTARVLDRIFRTHFATCDGCADRQAKLNRLMPFGGGGGPIKTD